MTKMSIYYVDTTNINVHMSNNKASKYKKQNWYNLGRNREFNDNS